MKLRGLLWRGMIVLAVQMALIVVVVVITWLIVFEE